MTRPVIYYSNVFRFGALSGSVSGFETPVERVADDYTGLFYPTSGDATRIQVDLGNRERTARFLMLPRMRSASGSFVFVQSISGGIVSGVDPVSGVRYHGAFEVSGDGPQVHKLVSAGELGSRVAGGLPDPSTFAGDGGQEGLVDPVRYWRTDFIWRVPLTLWTEAREFIAITSGTGNTNSALNAHADGFTGAGRPGFAFFQLMNGSLAFLQMPASGWHLRTPLRPSEWSEFSVDIGWNTSASPKGLVSAAFVLSDPGVGEYRWMLDKGLVSGLMTMPSGSVQADLATVTMPLTSATVSGASGFTASRWRFECLLVGQIFPDAFFIGNVSGTKTAAQANAGAAEVMLGSGLLFPRDHQVGVERAVLRQFIRTEMDGGEPFMARTGDDLKETRYQLITTEAETASGIEQFIRTNDAGEPFLFRDDLGELYWAELPESDQTYADEAGVWGYELLIRQVPED